jgi:hypothetical protein
MKIIKLLFIFLFIMKFQYSKAVEIFNIPGGGSLETGWVSNNNVNTNPINQTTYYLLEAGSTSDNIITSVYDISAYTSAYISIDIATFNSGTNNPAKIEISYNGGTSYTQTATTTTPTSSSYINYMINLSTISSQVRIRISNNGSSGRGVRIQNFFVEGILPISNAKISINEVSQGGTSGSPDYVELVAVGSPCTNIDIRDWILDEGVKNIDAWLIADGNSGVINTCAQVPNTADLTVSKCINPLTVNGPVVTNRLLLHRTNGSGGGVPATLEEPAEIFRNRGDSYLWAWNYVKGSNNLTSTKQTELPPRF